MTKATRKKWKRANRYVDGGDRCPYLQCCGNGDSDRVTDWVAKEARTGTWYSCYELAASLALDGLSCKELP